jgi:hypothetical protein
MKLCMLLIVSGALCLLSGCAEYWYQEGKTFNECKAARAECFQELKKRTDFADPTAEYEVKFMNECMREKGYREVKADELPLSAKREEPDTALHWRARGLAGQLDEK